MVEKVTDAIQKEIHRIDLQFKDVDAAMAKNHAEIYSLRDAHRHAKERAEKDLKSAVEPMHARLSSAETVIKEADAEIRKFSQNYVNVIALIEAAKKDIEAIQADQKETKALIRKIAWYVFGLLITVIGYGIVTAIQLATRG